MSEHGIKASRIYPYLMGLALVILTTLAGEAAKRYLDPTNLVMLYLLAVVAAAVWWGSGSAVTTCVLGVVAFDFFLVPPYLTFRVDDIKYLFTFGVLLAVGLVISALAAKARQEALRRETEKLHVALLNSISHDLKTPLVSITGALDSLLQDWSLLDESMRKDFLDTAAEDAGRLNRLVGNLLDMTRIEAGAIHLRRKPCELRDLIGSSIVQLGEKVSGRSVHIEIPPDFPEPSLDYALMMKVFANLIDNAVKYSLAGEPITITARAAEDYIRIEVRDLGYGIAADDLKRIFDKFYRAVKPRQITGTGLGLSICKGIVEAHGGRIWAEKNQGSGSTFVVLLPLVVHNAR